MRRFLFLILLLAPSLCWGQFATTMDSSDVAGWNFTTFDNVTDTCWLVRQNTSDTLWAHLDDSTAILWVAITDTSWAVRQSISDSLFAHLDDSTAILWIAISDTAWMVLGAIDDSIKNGYQIYQKIDTTDAVIDSAVGAERAAVAASIDEATSSVWAGRVSDETGTGLWVYGTSPTFTTDITSPLVIGGTATTSDLSLKTTSGVGASGADMHFLVGNNGATEAMTILNNGYVGIGTATPVGPLEIVAAAPAGNIGGFASGMLHVRGAGSALYSNSVITGHNSFGGNTQLWYLGSGSFSNDDVAFINRQNANLVLSTNNIGRMTIDAGGNVGIGTDAPTSKVEVVSTLNVLADLAVEENYHFKVRNPNNTIGEGIGISFGMSGTGSQQTAAIVAKRTGANGQGDLRFYTKQSATSGVAPALGMIIDSAGNVGIGTASPDEILHLFANNAALKLEDDSENDATINVGNSQLCIAIDPDDLIGSSDICFDIDGSEVARFHASTNFGIGTLSPPERISVVGNIAMGDTATGDVDVYLYFGTDGSWLTKYLMYDDGEGRFKLSDDLYLSGTVLSADTLTKSFVIASPDDTFDFPFWQTKRAITIVAVSAVCTGGTNVVGALQEYNATGTSVDAAVDGDWTITTSEYTDASFSNPGIDAGDWLGWKTTSVSGSVTFFSITFEYTEQ